MKEEEIYVQVHHSRILVAPEDAPPSAWPTICATGLWRLPTITELERMYHELFLKGQANLTAARYWSGSEFSPGVAWYFDFERGMDGTALKVMTCHVRLVSDVT